MDWLRSNKGWRVLVAFLTASLLPMLVAPTPRAGSQAVSEDYGEWLRSQLRTPANEAFDDAVASAHDAEPESFAEFLQAFAEAYAAMDPDESLADVLATPNMSADAVLAYLQKRMVHARGVTLAAPTALLTEEQAASATTTPGAVADIQSPYDLSGLMKSSGPIVHAGALVLTPLHVLFSAQPRGP